MFDRTLMVRRFVVLGAAVAATATAVPLRNRRPSPALHPAHPASLAAARRGPIRGRPRHGSSTRQTTPRLGEGLNGTDRSWLTSSRNGGDIAVPSDSFEWGDAAIGAGTATATLLVLAGSAVAIRRRFSPAQRRFFFLARAGPEVGTAHHPRRALRPEMRGQSPRIELDVRS